MTLRVFAFGTCFWLAATVAGTVAGTAQQDARALMQERCAAGEALACRQIDILDSYLEKRNSEPTTAGETTTAHDDETARAIEIIERALPESTPIPTLTLPSTVDSRDDGGWPFPPGAIGLLIGLIIFVTTRNKTSAKNEAPKRTGKTADKTVEVATIPSAKTEPDPLSEGATEADSNDEPAPSYITPLLWERMQTLKRLGELPENDDHEHQLAPWDETPMFDAIKAMRAKETADSPRDQRLFEIEQTSGRAALEEAEYLAHECPAEALPEGHKMLITSLFRCALDTKTRPFAILPLARYLERHPFEREELFPDEDFALYLRHAFHHADDEDKVAIAKILARFFVYQAVTLDNGGYLGEALRTIEDAEGQTRETTRLRQYAKLYPQQRQFLDPVDHGKPRQNGQSGTPDPSHH